MIIKLFFGFIVLIAIFSFLHKYKKAPPAQRKQWLITVALAVVVIAVIAGALTGRVPLVAGLAAIAATVFRYGWRFGLPAYRLWLAKSGGNATFKSNYLLISVNINNGQMQGDILKGEFAGQTLAELDAEQLQKLQIFFNQQDKKSYYLLNAYLRSRGFAHFTDAPNNKSDYDEAIASAPSTNELSLAEALEILGFSTAQNNALPNKDEITKAHRRLIAKLHPDKGGSDYLAARVNLAREVLLKRLDKI